MENVREVFRGQGYVLFEGALSQNGCLCCGVSVTSCWTNRRRTVAAILTRSVSAR